MLGGIVLAWVGMAAWSPITDAMALAALGDRSGAYGRFRAWTSAAWAVAATTGGVAYALVGPDLLMLLFVAGIPGRGGVRVPAAPGTDGPSRDRPSVAAAAGAAVGTGRGTGAAAHPARAVPGDARQQRGQRHDPACASWMWVAAPSSSAWPPRRPPSSRRRCSPRRPDVRAAGSPPGLRPGAAHLGRHADVRGRSCPTPVWWPSAGASMASRTCFVTRASWSSSGPSCRPACGRPGSRWRGWSAAASPRSSPGPLAGAMYEGVGGGVLFATCSLLVLSGAAVAWWALRGPTFRAQGRTPVVVAAGVRLPRSARHDPRPIDAIYHRAMRRRRSPIARRSRAGSLRCPSWRRSRSGPRDRERPGSRSGGLDTGARAAALVGAAGRPGHVLLGGCRRCPEPVSAHRGSRPVHGRTRSPASTIARPRTPARASVAPAVTACHRWTSSPSRGTTSCSR